MVLENGILGLGFPEMIVVAVAVILLIEPKNIVYIKPIVKAAYKAWLTYKKDVENAEREMETVKSSMMQPIISAKNEAETELLAEKVGVKPAETKQAGKNKAPGKVEKAPQAGGNAK